MLSPLLANIVLNELDWWISSQWENMRTQKAYKKPIRLSGAIDNGYVYKMLRKSRLKEMYIVRYADDFKIFCRKRSDADKVFIAVKQWLKDRLSLEISEEKSKVVNLKKHYSEFLGFKLKAVRKGGKFVVRSHMSDKAVKRETEKLKEQIKAIEFRKNTEDEIKQIYQYNSIVFGVHNYYRYATAISLDCKAIQFQINIAMFNRLKGRIGNQGGITQKFIAEQYGTSKMLRYIHKMPICPIGYVQTKNPMYKKRTICKYTAEGREEIHRNLKFDETVMTVLHML
ncbi:group II intron reverse transcriptase/maturase, partial [bacterium]|nr:group II intron reverse transcriptase/maturase [bacterium]